MKSVGFISAKGGQGVTTTACSFAVLASQARPVVIVASIDTRACLGMAETGTKALDNLRVIDPKDYSAESTADELVVFDGEAGDYTLMVTRSCYLSLRRGVNAPNPYDSVVVVREEGRALNDGDIARALGKPVLATVRINPVVARAVDAGLLAMRLPSAMSEDLAPLMQHLLGVPV